MQHPVARESSVDHHRTCDVSQSVYPLWPPDAALGIGLQHKYYTVIRQLWALQGQRRNLNTVGSQLLISPSKHIGLLSKNRSEQVFGNSWLGKGLGKDQAAHDKGWHSAASQHYGITTMVLIHFDINSEKLKFILGVYEML